MSRPAKTTKISNTTLNTAKKALDSWTDKHDNGEFVLEPPVYESFSKASGVIRCEMSKQHPVKKKRTTLKVEIINGDEAQEFRRSQLAQEKQVDCREVN